MAGRQEEVEYEQDRLGNERKKLDAVRAQSGMEGQDTDEGIVDIGSAETGTIVTAYSFPTHVESAYLSLIHAFNSVGSGLNTFSIYALDLDGSGNITGSTLRSVPINVDSGATRSIEYEGIEFSRAIGVESEFQGRIGLGLFVDHPEFVERDTEDTSTP